MMLGMVRRLAAFTFACALAACGGKLAPSPGPADTMPPPAGDEGATTGVDPLACTTEPLSPTRACVPAKGREKSAIQIEIDRPTGCLPCGATVQPCSVDVQGDQITVSTNVQVCTADVQSCSCVSASATCQLPPLPAGTFTVTLADEGPRSGLPPRQLVVEPTGEVACSLTDPSGIPTIDLPDYATSCETDADCTLATTGDSCQPCACPNAAISTKSQARYEGDARAAMSQCDVAQLGNTTCAGCPQQTAFCSASKVCAIAP